MGECACHGFCDRLKPGFEPTQSKTQTQTHVFTEAAADSNQTLADVMQCFLCVGKSSREIRALHISSMEAHNSA